jgi:hypothetical protein
MSTTQRTISATPQRVDAVLCDGWNYADWVVGAVHVRSVDKQWPKPGSRVHHRVGGWPLTIADNTEVISYVPGQSLELQARMWPFGEATVRLDWEPAPQGNCRVTMVEQFVQGPALALRNRAADLLLHARNTEALARLENLTHKYDD